MSRRKRETFEVENTTLNTKDDSGDSAGIANANYGLTKFNINFNKKIRLAIQLTRFTIIVDYLLSNTIRPRVILIILLCKSDSLS